MAPYMQSRTNAFYTSRRCDSTISTNNCGTFIARDFGSSQIEPVIKGPGELALSLTITVIGIRVRSNNLTSQFLMQPRLNQPI